MSRPKAESAVSKDALNNELAKIKASKTADNLRNAYAGALSGKMALADKITLFEAMQTKLVGKTGPKSEQLKADVSSMLAIHVAAKDDLAKIQKKIQFLGLDKKYESIVNEYKQYYEQNIQSIQNEKARGVRLDHLITDLVQFAKKTNREDIYDRVDHLLIELTKQAKNSYLAFMIDDHLNQIRQSTQAQPITQKVAAINQNVDTDIERLREKTDKSEFFNQLHDYFRSQVARADDDIKNIKMKAFLDKICSLAEEAAEKASIPEATVENKASYYELSKGITEMFEKIEKLCIKQLPEEQIYEIAARFYHVNESIKALIDKSPKP